MSENPGTSRQRQVLITVLVINAGLFGLEMVMGIVARSLGLVADSLDMLADAFVYGLSAYAIGKAAARKRSIVKLSGFLELSLALFGLAEAIRRFLGFEEAPDFRQMILISLVALAGNAACIYLLKKLKSQEAHIRATMIFTNNDVLVNIGVIVAGIAVYLTGSKYPDIVIGSFVFLLVIRGAIRILRLK
jgi:Co/Zn/Cd efflux system component